MIPFSPLSKEAIKDSILQAFNSQCSTRLDCPLEHFDGEGIYAIVYFGRFELYNDICHNEIYVGRSRKRKSRKAKKPTSDPLYNRICEHIKSIEAAENLELNWFEVRWLVLDELFIDLGEQILLEHYRPLWNVTVDGFGNHDPGSGRRGQLLSDWDILHPGRTWTKKHSAPTPMEKKAVEDKVRTYWDE